MPVTIKAGQMGYKSPSSGEYVGINGVAERTTAEQVADVEAAGTAAVALVQTKADEVTAQLANASEVRNMIAGVFDPNTAYTAGQYVIQTVTVSGSSVNKLFRFKVDHAAGAWNSSEVDEIKLADDVADLKSAFNSHIDFEGTKNLLKNTLINATAGNVTFTRNDDGSVTIDGTSNTTVYRPIGTVILKSGVTYIISGSITALAIQVNNEDNTVTYVTSGGGNIAEYTPETDISCSVRFRIGRGITFSNAKAYPMIRIAGAGTDVYDYYSYTNRELTTKMDVVEGQVSQDSTKIQQLSDTAIYPFTLDSTLYRPGYPEQVVYSRELNGIKRLVIIAPDNLDYYVSMLFAYSSLHESVIEIKNTNGRTGIYTTTRSSSADRPTETITINDANGVVMAIALIDWSKINKASGLGLNIESTRIAEDCILRTDAPIRFLPIEDYYVTNFKQRIYFDEICRGANGGYFVVTATGATYPEVTYTDRYIEFNVTTTKEFTIEIQYVREGIVMDSVSIDIHCNVSAIPAKKYMFIGDSYTNSGYMQNWFYDNNSGLVTLYGTRGTAPYLHEGRSRWRVQDYFAESKGGVTNPFYNPTSKTFDFSYYMRSDGPQAAFRDVDVVNILLGRNNGFSLNIMTNMQTIINSIHDYNADIKIFVMVGSNVAADNSGAGRYLQNNQEMNLSCFRYNSVVEYENATIIWQNCNLDDVYDFEMEEVDATPLNPAKVKMYTDNVHPSQYGYQDFGVVFNGYMHNLLNT